MVTTAFYRAHICHVRHMEFTLTMNKEMSRAPKYVRYVTHVIALMCSYSNEWPSVTCDMIHPNCCRDAYVIVSDVGLALCTLFLIPCYHDLTLITHTYASRIDCLFSGDHVDAFSRAQITIRRQSLVTCLNAETAADKTTPF